ncbi:MAG: ABC transporter permease [Cyclobacteriaceae bacterium]|nr:ABC transporter permease [Cyclobacteriaceae bacterium SS2]
MFKTYLKITWRNLLRNKFNTVLNITGLTIGITCFLIIFSKIDFESGFDRFHKDADQIYRIVRVTSGLAYLEGGLEYRTGVNFPLPGVIDGQVPELESVTTMMHMGGSNVKIVENDASTKPQLFNERRGIALVDEHFFDVLNFNHQVKWITGDPSVLKDPFQVVLTQSIAKKYFGTEDLLGRQIEFNGMIFQVSGLISDFPIDSDFQFQVLASMETFDVVTDGALSTWGGLSDSYQCLVKIKPGSDIAQIEEKIKQIHATHTSAETAAFRVYKLQPLAEIHQDSRFGNYNNRIVSQSTILSLMSIGILLIVMACINYSNLTTAQLASRGKSAGIHKVLGNTRKRLISQILLETLILSVVATIGGVVLSILLMNNLNQLIGLPEDWNFLNLKFALFLLALPATISIVAGIYPAILISKTNIVEMIRNKGFSTAQGSGKFNRWMVTFQFIIAQILIVCGVVIFRQLNFIESKDMGYHRNNILVVGLMGDEQMKTRFKNELKNNPNISLISLSSEPPAREGNFRDASRMVNGLMVTVDIEQKSVDPNYLETYGIRLLHGRDFRLDDDETVVVVNQKAVEELQFNDASDAIGHTLKFNGQDRTIIGVVENFHTSPIYNPLRPCYLEFLPNRFYTAGIRFNLTGDDQHHSQISGLISDVEAKWSQIYPNEIFEYAFFDDTIAAYYEEEKKTASLVHIFTIIMIFVCCLGIIGLIHYTTVRKAKEVAVRKIIGATFIQVAGILLRNFAEWVVIANLVAWPIAYFLMDGWLQSFTYKTNMAWWIFLLSGCIAMVIALFTAGYHTIRAARVNPVEVLRSE